MSEQAILSHPYDTAHLPAAGAAVAFEANAAQLTALADAYGLLSVERLAVTATLMPADAGAVAVDGRVTADIVQACVVSLEPVPQHIDEAFAVRFVPPDSREARTSPSPGKEVAVDPDAPDPPEVMQGTTIDPGALAEEMFVLAIDPYPRAPGAELSAAAGDEADAAEESPFAALRGVIGTRK